MELTTYQVTTYWPDSEREVLTKIGQVCGGIDFGADLELLCPRGRFAVYRRPGHQTWLSTFRPQAYIPAEYWLVEFVEWDWEAKDFAFEILVKKQPGHRWKTWKAKLCAEAAMYETGRQLKRKG